MRTIKKSIILGLKAGILSNKKTGAEVCLPIFNSDMLGLFLEM